MGAFLTYLASGVVGALGVLLNVFTEAFNWWRYTIVFGVFSMIGVIWYTASAFVTTVSTALNNLPHTLSLSPLSTGILSIVANVFPLAVMASCIAVYVTAMIAWITYRTIKSYIPTLTGT